MSFSTQNDADRNASVTDAEKTLRLIATLPAPEDIADRVKSGLHSAPRKADVISWPTSATGARWTQLAAMRGAAAAAIVLVVAGGAWEVYTHIRIAPEPAAVAAPQRLDGSGGLSAAGAVRKPQTLEGPVVSVPANVEQRSDEQNSAVPAKSRDTRLANGKSKPAHSIQR
jgi:hypothetical protein